MKRMHAHRSIAATSLLTLTLIATAPHVALAEGQADDETSTESAATTQGDDARATDPTDLARAADAEPAASGDTRAAESTAAAIDGAASQAPAASSDANATAAQADATQHDAQPSAAEALPSTTMARPDSAQPSPVSSQASAPQPAAAENGIPHITIFVDESDQAIADARTGDAKHSYGTLDDLHRSPDHSVRCIGGAQIVVPAGFASEYGSASTPTAVMQLKYIRGRGNATWSVGDTAKRAYKLELQKKQDFFGMGKAKEWALIANVMDPTLIKNRIVYWLGSELGLPYTPQLVPVDVTMVRVKGGQQTSSTPLGSYYLSELVEIGKSRLAIDELDETDEADVTGGHLLTMYRGEQNAGEPKSTVFTTDSGITLINKNPGYPSENLTPAQRKQRAYIRGYIAELDRLIMGTDTIDSAAYTAISDLLDLRSTADYWWLQEFSNNADGFDTSSTYLYKARGGKLCWGPLWDFDIAFPGANDKPTSGFNNTFMPWIDALREKGPYFIELLKERWSNPLSGLDAKLRELTRPGGKLDTYRDETRSSWNANQALWGSDPNDAAQGKTLDERVEELRSYIETRRAWINEHLDEIGKAHFNVGFVANGQQVKQVAVRANQFVWPLPEAPEREGFVFTGWVEQKSGKKANEYVQPTEDCIYVAEYVTEDEIDYPTDLFFRKREVWADATFGMAPPNQIKAFPFNATLGKIAWISSDESVATVDSHGMLTLLKSGTATITATLKNGSSGSYQLHVFDGATITPADPTAIEIEPRVTVKKGKAIQPTCALLPSDQPATFDFMHFSVDDPTVASVDAFGVVYGLKPGTTTLRVRVDDPMGGSSIEAACEIMVEADQQSGVVAGRRAASRARGSQAAEATVDASPQAEANKQIADSTHAASAKKQAAQTKQLTKQLRVANEKTAGQHSASTKADMPTKAQATSALPQTGDTARPGLLAGILCLALATLTGGLLPRRKS